MFFFLLIEVVLQGVSCCRGAFILMADADGATHFPDVERLEEAIVRSIPADVAQRNVNLRRKKCFFSVKLTQ